MMGIAALNPSYGIRRSIETRVGWVEALDADTHRFYRWRFAGDVVLFQVGRFFEFYAKPDDEIARA